MRMIGAGVLIPFAGTPDEGIYMHIRFTGAHNTGSATSKNLSLLVDGIIALDAGDLTYALTLPEQRRIKAIFLTHQHYDHVRDLLGIGIAFYHRHLKLNVYGTKVTGDILSSHLLDGLLYPSFLEKPPENPVIKFNIIEPDSPVEFAGYRLRPVSVNHGVAAVGYEVTSPEGRNFFYTGDTGPGLAGVWEKISPEILVIEVTLSNRHDSLARESQHLTPNLLKEELLSFQKIRGYLPKVTLAHMDPEDEAEIKAEVAAISKELTASISLAYEGMEISL